jgi:hypothetical protein
MVQITDAEFKELTDYRELSRIPRETNAMPWSNPRLIELLEKWDAGEGGGKKLVMLETDELVRLLIEERKARNPKQ